MDFINICVMFIIIDWLLDYVNLKGKYVFLHAIHNGYITYITLPDFYNTILHRSTSQEINLELVHIIIGLHLYHMISYRDRLVFDDFLHHGIMIGFLMPLIVYYKSILDISANVFHIAALFITGFPGGMNYILLFLTKNNYISRMTQKSINVSINAWIRNPGCIFVCVAGINDIIKNFFRITLFQTIIFISMNLILAWNGIYYNNMVAIDYGRKTKT